MTMKHSPEFERAVRIEMLRARAAVDRHMIAQQASGLVNSLDPRLAIGRLLPSDMQGMVSRGLRMFTRYPYLLSAVLSNKRFKKVRWVSAAALVIGAWAMFSGNSANDAD